MFDSIFSAEAWQFALEIVKSEFLLGIWETFYVTVVSTALAIVIGLPLGVLLVTGDKGGVMPLPKTVMSTLNIIINLLFQLCLIAGNRCRFQHVK